MPVDLATLFQSIAATHHLLELILPQLDDKLAVNFADSRSAFLNIDHELDHLTSK